MAVDGESECAAWKRKKVSACGCLLSAQVKVTNSRSGRSVVQVPRLTHKTFKKLDISVEF